ncbi:MAG: thiamine-phosphate kinase, partial [Nitrososphaerota archaeon]|nr:thiamine-phosphate kinase [Nitrososphaerota archaeon]
MNERQIIEEIRKAFGAAPATDEGMFDDVVRVDPGKGKLILKADMFVADTDMPPGMTLRQAARKSLISCLSDFAAKGATPEGFMVSLALPRRLSGRRTVQDIVSGLRDASREYSVRLVAGDVNESKSLSIDCIMYGFSGAKVTRGGARPGDSVIATGPFGYSALGLRHLLAGLRLPREVVARCVSSVTAPRPDFRTIRDIASSGMAHSSMDSSDGLARTLHEISRQSGVRIEMTTLPTDDALKELLRGGVLADAVLYGGEEFIGVATIPPDRMTDATRMAKKAGGRIYEFGAVREGSGVVYKTPDG